MYSGKNAKDKNKFLIDAIIICLMYIESIQIIALHNCLLCLLTYANTLSVYNLNTGKTLYLADVCYCINQYMNDIWRVFSLFIVKYKRVIKINRSSSFNVTHKEIS